MKSSCSKPYLLRRIVDNKILQVRCCEISKGKDDGDFDIEWQFYSNGKWVKNNSICTSDYSFFVNEEDVKGIQMLIPFS